PGPAEHHRASAPTVGKPSTIVSGQSRARRRTARLAHSSSLATCAATGGAGASSGGGFHPDVPAFDSHERATMSPGGSVGGVFAHSLRCPQRDEDASFPFPRYRSDAVGNS